MGAEVITITAGCLSAARSEGTALLARSDGRRCAFLRRRCFLEPLAMVTSIFTSPLLRFRACNRAPAVRKSTRRPGRPGRVQTPLRRDAKLQFQSPYGGLSCLRNMFFRDGSENALHGKWIASIERFSNQWPLEALYNIA